MAEGEGHSEGGSGVLRELVAVFGFDVDTKKVEEGENRLSQFVNRVKELAEGVAAAFAVEKIYEFVEANVQAMHAIDHASARLGISAESVQKWQFAARSAGEDADALLSSMGRLQVTQQQAEQGSTQAAKGFGLLGMKAADLKGLGADEMFLRVADGISKIEDPAKQATAATELFGRSGRELLPILKRGREGLDELTASFGELGGGYSKQAREESEQFEEQSAKLNLTLTSLRSTIMVQLLPVVTLFERGLTKVVNWIREMTKESNIVQATLVVLGAIATAFAIKMAIAFAPVIAIAAALAALVLIVDDLITMMKGGDSLTGEWIDKIWGKDAHLEVVQGLKDAWVGTMAALKDSVPVIKQIYDMLSAMVHFISAINVFGRATQLFDNAKAADRQAAIRNALSGGKGRGGLSLQERAITDSAKLYLAAEARGEQGLTPESYLTVPKGMTRGQALTARMNTLDQMRGAGYSPSTAATFGPSLPPVSMSSEAFHPAHRNVTLVQHIHPSKGMNEKHLGDHAANSARPVLKQAIREAAANVPRARSSQ
jgi:hypothetical protein